MSATSTGPLRSTGRGVVGLAGVVLALTTAVGCRSGGAPPRLSFSPCATTECDGADDALIAAVQTSVRVHEPQEGGTWGLVALHPPSTTDTGLMRAAITCATLPQALSVVVDSVTNPRGQVLSVTYRLRVWTNGIAVCQATLTDEVAITEEDWLRVINGSIEAHGIGRFWLFAQPGAFRVEPFGAAAS